MQHKVGKVDALISHRDGNININIHATNGDKTLLVVYRVSEIKTHEKQGKKPAK
jgi:hypothetical protein